jgi:hypothetical protein
MRELTFQVLGLTAVCAVALGAIDQPPSTPPTSARSGQERRLSNVRQLPKGREHAEAGFSQDVSRLVFQSTRTSAECDQIFSMFCPDSARLVFASNRGAKAEGETNVSSRTGNDKGRRSRQPVPAAAARPAYNECRVGA